MSKHKFNLFVRQFAWAFVWVIFCPEMFSFENWKDGSSMFLSGLLMYMASGFMLEALYRWIAWGRWYPTKQYPAAIRPECPDHPWISILDGYPEPSVLVEVFCADGKERQGRAYIRDDDVKGLATFFDGDELQIAQSPDAWRLRPTHWRYSKNGPDNVIPS